MVLGEAVLFALVILYSLILLITIAHRVIKSVIRANDIFIEQIISATAEIEGLRSEAIVIQGVTVATTRTVVSDSQQR